MTWPIGTYRVVCAITSFKKLPDDHVPGEHDKIVKTANGNLLETSEDLPTPTWEGPMQDEEGWPKGLDPKDLVDSSTWSELSDSDPQDGDTVVQYFLQKKEDGCWKLRRKM